MAFCRETSTHINRPYAEYDSQSIGCIVFTGGRQVNAADAASRDVIIIKSGGPLTKASPPGGKGGGAFGVIVTPIIHGIHNEANPIDPSVERAIDSMYYSLVKHH